MLATHVLRSKAQIDFDPSNVEHCLAALQPLVEGTVHPDLRFAVKPPFLTVPDQAMTLIALQFLTEKTGINYVQKYLDLVDTAPGASSEPVVSEPRVFRANPRPSKPVVVPQGRPHLRSV